MGENVNMLIGCINKLEQVIQTRYFYLNQETGAVKDVTLELCESIDSFNEAAREKRDNNEYALIIPYEYNLGMAQYSFGCGLSHYLQADQFILIERRHNAAGKTLSFPLFKCRISMYVPSDIKDILECTGVFDPSIQEALRARYVKQLTGNK
ncbi:hypothetical protein [Psychrobacillus sp. FSL H8-0510]|uniref:hypothetical protein n=1 Tax=Psychrobacillus sp. FSL H8-0510 TaxID=2921394 RepID=UPI0030FA8654